MGVKEGPPQCAYFNVRVGVGYPPETRFALKGLSCLGLSQSEHGGSCDSMPQNNFIRNVGGTSLNREDWDIFCLSLTYLHKLVNSVAASHSKRDIIMIFLLSTC